jgi:hypothetical protein
MKTAVTILVLGLLLCAAVMISQQNQIRVTLQVPKAGSLALVNSGLAPSQQVSIHVTRPESGEGPVIRLIARSNSRYRIQVEPSAVRLGPAFVAPNAGGSRLMAEATNVRIFSELPTLLEGPRISNGGNNGTPDNALVISVPVDFPEGVSQGDLTFRMEFLPD